MRWDTSVGEVSIDHSDRIAAVLDLHRDARDQGLFFQEQQGDTRGRTIGLRGKSLVWLGSCSYLGLEHEPALVLAAIAALRAHGTQFASSRGYVSLAEHRELEESLSAMFGGYALLGQTTTLAHAAVFDALVDERDAVVVDHQVHHSVQVATLGARAHGAHVEKLRHEDLARAPERVAALSGKYRRVWFTTDGVTSMYGDLAPYAVLGDVLRAAPNAWLYVDDAHGTGWAGPHGRGALLARLPIQERLVLATSLAKSFAAGGAAVVFPDPALREQVRLAGASMVFSGPLQPALLGAALASAALHLGPSLAERQEALWRRVRALKSGLRRAGLPLLVDNDVPIAFVPIGRPAAAIELASALEAAGYYVNVSMYPSVPQDRAGLRLTVTNHLEPADLTGVVAALEAVLPATLARHGTSVAELEDRFAPTRVGAAPARSTRRPPPAASHLRLETHASIQALDRREWDERLGSVGCVSADAMALVESVFAGPEPEHTWQREYVVVRDAAGAPVAMTVWVDLLAKDDLLDRAEVSALVEATRQSDPYYLTSRVAMSGGALSEGPHLWLDRSGPWADALRLLLAHGLDRLDARGLDRLVLRDLPADDEALSAVLRDEGLVASPMPDRFSLAIPPGPEEAAFDALPRRQRRRMRRRLDEHGAFTFREVRPGDGTDLAHLHAMYRDVAARNLQFNLFRLPERVLAGWAESPAWRVVVAQLPALAGDRPVAWWAEHHGGDTLAPLVCGLDYDWVRSHGAYRHALLEMVLRASRFGKARLLLGMEAEMEKRSLGATPERVVAWTFGRESYQAVALADLAEQVALARR